MSSVTRSWWLCAGLLACACKEKAAAPPPAPEHPAVPDLDVRNPHARDRDGGASIAVKAGKVAQLIPALNYTYVEVVDAQGRTQWLALPQLELDVGDDIEYPDKPPMRAFVSKALQRTFDTIVFTGGIRVVKCVAGKVHSRGALPDAGR